MNCAIILGAAQKASLNQTDMGSLFDAFRKDKRYGTVKLYTENIWLRFTDKYARLDQVVIDEHKVSYHLTTGEVKTSLDKLQGLIRHIPPMSLQLSMALTEQNFNRLHRCAIVTSVGIIKLEGESNMRAEKGNSCYLYKTPYKNSAMHITVPIICNGVDVESPLDLFGLYERNADDSITFAGVPQNVCTWHENYNISWQEKDYEGVLEQIKTFKLGYSVMSAIKTALCSGDKVATEDYAKALLTYYAGNTQDGAMKSFGVYTQEKLTTPSKPRKARNTTAVKETSPKPAIAYKPRKVWSAEELMGMMKQARGA